MKFEAEIQYRATMVLQLLDAYTGRIINTPNVKVKLEDKFIPIVVKSDGFAVILNVDDPYLDVTVYVVGYEPMEVRLEQTVRWDRPMLLHMIPEIKLGGFQTHLTLEGVMPGITELSAVYLSGYILRFKSYTPRTQKMAVFNRHNKPLSRIRHGLLSMDESSFIPFSAYPQKDVEEILVEDFQGEELPPINAPIGPLIVGMTSPDGRYLLRVSDDSSHPVYLVRFVVDGTNYFQRLDFYSQEKIILERGDIS